MSNTLLTYDQQKDMLNNVSNSLSKYQNETKSVYEEQSRLMSALADENNHLQQQKHRIDEVNSTDNRLVLFNQSFNKRFMDYIKMMVLSAISLGIIIILVTLNRMEIISSSIATILSIAVISISIIILFNMYYTQIRRRDNMNYDRIATIAPPDKLFAGSHVTDTSLNLSTGLCIGSQCCDNTTTIWNVDTSTCVKLPANEGFTATSSTFANEFSSIASTYQKSASDISQNQTQQLHKLNNNQGNIQPFESFSGSSYAKV